jgi:hypothetical protein
MLLALLAAVGVTAIVAAGPGHSNQILDHDYIGADRCRSCHTAEFEAWERSPHARAFQRLSESERQDQRCQQCHTMVPGDTQAALTGVQCESCHGPGRHYSLDHVMRDKELAAALSLVAKLDAAACTRCHDATSPALGAFDHEAKLKLIKHWKD